MVEAPSVLDWISITRAPQLSQLVKNLPAMQETQVRFLGWEYPPGEGNGSPLQCFCLEDPMDRGVWWATVHGVERDGHDLVTKPPELWSTAFLHGSSWKHCRLGDGDSSPIPYQTCHCILYGLICMPLEFFLSLKIGNKSKSGRPSLSCAVCAIWPLHELSRLLLIITSSYCSHLCFCVGTVIATPKASLPCTSTSRLAWTFQFRFSFVEPL